MFKRKKLLALICCLSVAISSFVLVYAADYVVSQDGSIGACLVHAQNKIREDRKHADATTTVSIPSGGGTASTSVTATFYYIGVDNDEIGKTGSYYGFGYGPNGCGYSKDVPNDDYRFYRAESSHQATYQQGVFSVPSLVNAP